MRDLLLLALCTFSTQGSWLEAATLAAAQGLPPPVARPGVPDHPPPTSPPSPEAPTAKKRAKGSFLAVAKSLSFGSRKARANDSK